MKLSEAADTFESLAKTFRTLSSFKSADAVADFLAKNGVKGVGGDSVSCPLANFVRKNVKKFGNTVEIDGSVLSFAVETNEFGDETRISVDLSPALNTFVSRFDDVSDGFDDEPGYRRFNAAKYRKLRK